MTQFEYQRAKNLADAICGNICARQTAEIGRLDSVNADLLAALEMAVAALRDNDIDESMAGEFEILTDAIARAKGE